MIGCEYKDSNVERMTDLRRFYFDMADCFSKESRAQRIRHGSFLKESRHDYNSFHPLNSLSINNISDGVRAVATVCRGDHTFWVPSSPNKPEKGEQNR